MFEEYLTQIKNIYNNKLLSAEETCYFIGRILEEYEKACPNCGSYSKEDCGCNEVCPTPRAADGWESGQKEKSLPTDVDRLFDWCAVTTRR